MKKIFSIICLSCLLASVTSCDDFLTETPTVAIPTEDAFVSANDYTIALNGVYYTLGTYRFLGRDIQALGEVASDNSDHSAATSHFYNIFSYQILNTNAYLEEIWRYGYAAIDRATRIIVAGESATDMEGDDMTTINYCVAQAYGARALSMFYLTNIFGLPYSDANKSSLGVVNVTKTIAPFEKVERTTVEENYRQILADIAKSKEFYGKEGVEDAQYIHMNQAAVAALEARVKLYMQDYAGAINAAHTAIELRDGMIVSTAGEYWQMFKELLISSEDIFVIAKSETDYLSANSLNTLWNKYGVSLNKKTIDEFADTDIRKSLLIAASWDGGKLGGIATNNQIQNLPVLRLPELYLTLAEAYAATGNYGEAKKNLLEVAVKRDASYAAEGVKEDASIMAVIRQERKLELAQEGHRFFDARRWNEVIDVANGTLKNFDVAKFQFPIPAKEVNAGAGVVQTPSWDANLPK
ncbi:RagB/SusD family nutrient uptake outer membrane protein [Parabacteroides sp. PF5-9]|uniref:RagB/SusD family nutrient uptake outer membrane protein n=1 Tax=Parabacteroides sp. PF5-9 TaxID=1742404 RepID=UPI002477058E|nr:RagB/SusD family nutrient uptake outer membrane protein [Parabacteroides sp. PF5-9]MDH6356937.1 tetratricopeptide (TPR) repeat protein [Parabacteroides sp. PF5-9]